MKVFEELLENYWILKEENEELYYEIKDQVSSIKDFLKLKFGYKIIITPLLIKLEKIPGIPCEIFGIEEFTQKEEYVILCLILMFLEDKIPNEQFILSQLIDYIKATLLDIPSRDVVLDFTRYSNRKMMVNVLKFITAIKFIRKYDGDENRFADSVETEVLYEVTGISKYFMRNFSNNIQNCQSYRDIWEGETLDLEQDKGDERRHRIYRRIFTEPIIYEQNSEDLDYLYIKNYKNMIDNDVQNMLDSKLFVNKNGAYVLLDESKRFKDAFPSSKAISDISLFVCAAVIKNKEVDTLKINVNGTVDISEFDLDQIILGVKQKYESGFSVEYREMEESKFVKHIKQYLKEVYMLQEISEDKRRYQIMPLMFRICGKYPETFDSKIEEEKV